MKLPRGAISQLAKRKDSFVRKYLMRLVIFIACFSVSSWALADVIGYADKEVQEIAEPILDGILQGFKDNDYTQYAKNFDDMLKESVPEKRFLAVDQQIEGSMGEFKSREYLGFLNQGQITVILWKGQFEKSENDILIKLVISKRANTFVVTGLWFQ